MLGITVRRDGDKLKVTAPAGAVTKDLRLEMAERKAELLAILPGAPIQLTPRDQPFTPVPLTPNQRRLWFLDKLDGGSSAFVMVTAWELRGELDVKSLSVAIEQIAERHTVLGSLISDGDTGPVMTLMPQGAVSLVLRDSKDSDPAALVTVDAQKAFALDREPPMRAQLTMLGPDRWVLQIALHHIVSDSWSMGVLMRDLSALYTQSVTNAPANLPVLPVQFADVALWQRATLDDARCELQLDYWRRQLQGAPTDLALPFDRPRAAVRGDKGGVVRFVVPREATHALLDLARREGTTSFVVMLSVYAVLLSRWTGQDELMIGCPASNRDRSETHNLLGFFVNNLALRIDLTDQPDFLTLTRRLRQVCLDALVHQDVPFDRVVEALNPQRTLNRGPLFQTMCVLQTAQVQPFVLPGLLVQALPISTGAPELDLNLSMETDGDVLIGHLEYDASLFNAETVQHMADGFVQLAKTVLQKSDVSAALLPLLNDEALARRVAAWRAPVVSPQKGSILDLIDLHARSTPDAPAIVQNDVVLTYGQLDLLSDLLAQHLLLRGMSAGSIVGVVATRSVDLVVALLGVLKAGGAYVVFDTSQPTERISTIFSDTGLAWVIAPVACKQMWPTHVGIIRLKSGTVTDQMGADSSLSRPETAFARQKPFQSPAPDHLAYICFTSGSTGMPKGVAVEHHSLVNHAVAMVREYALTPGDKVLQFASPEFDVALEEIFPTLVAGATLIMRGAEDTEALDLFTTGLDQRGITVLNLPAPFWHAWTRHLVDTGADLPRSLRLLVTGSDRVSSARLEEWRTLFGDRIAWRNAYGPTEGTVTTTIFDPSHYNAASQDTVPIGRAIDGVRVEVLDALGQPVPIGVIGEIVIGGYGVARGYLNRPDETAARFKSDLCPDGTLRRTFWTGDQARLRSDGSLDFVGRRDDQVKIRGYRIEPGEVASALSRHPQVRSTTVLALRDSFAELRLVAFVVAGSQPLDTPQLLQWLSGLLPAYMIPAAFVFLEHLPMTPSGKVDRRALANLGIADNAVVKDTLQVPKTDAEKELAAIFAAVLGIQRVGIDDNFFDLGGDSIRSLQIVSRARQAGFDLSVSQVFQNQTVAALAGAANRATPKKHIVQKGTGQVPVSPIQAWFHATMAAEPHHYQQAVLLAVPDDLDAVLLERALTSLLAHHDMLRMSVSAESGRLTQNIDAAVPLESRDAGLLEVMHFVEKIGNTDSRQMAFEHLHRSMDLSQGRLFRALLIPHEHRLLLTAHHLAVDAVSWDILIDDLETAYRQLRDKQSVALAPVTTPYRAWAGHLHELAASAELQQEARWWQETLQAATLRPAPYEALPGTVGEMAQVVLTLDASLTATLRRDVQALFGATPQEALLVALRRAAQSFCHHSGDLRIDIERHGRTSLGDEVDVSRTVGWFTTVQPLLLRHRAEDDLKAEFKSATDALAAAPREGIGFGLLSYLAPNPDVRARMAELPAAQVLLNYLGIVGAHPAPEESNRNFLPVDEALGPLLSSFSQRSHVIEINAGVVSGCLRVDFSYPKTLADSLRGFAEATLRALREIASESATKAALGKQIALTPLQQGVLAHSLISPDTYLNQLRMVLEGSLDQLKLKAAWAAVIDRHESLRASFNWYATPHPVQIFASHCDMPWSVHDWTDVLAEEKNSRMTTLLATDKAQGFELLKAPLMRMHLVCHSPVSHELVWSTHHLLMDGWSVSVVMREVFAAYRALVANQPLDLPAAPAFSSYLQRVHSYDTLRGQNFWREELAGIDSATPIAMPGLAPAGIASESAEKISVNLLLDEEETKAISALAKRSRVTVSTVVQGAWAILLQRYTGLSDVVFGVTVSGRPRDLDGAEQMVGMMINTVPARINVDGNAAVVLWLQSLFARHLQRDEHGHTALADIARFANLPSGRELFQSLVLFQNYPEAGELSAQGLQLTQVEAYEDTNFALTLSCQPGAQMSFTLLCDSARFRAAVSQRMLEHFHHLLKGLTSSDGGCIAELAMLGKSEACAVLAFGQGPVQAVPPALAHEWLAHWANVRPNAPAIESHDRSLSHLEFATATDAFAAQLSLQGVTKGSAVAVCLQRSSYSALAFYAILKAGGVAVPLDSAYPSARLQFMLADSGAQLVLVDATSVQVITKLGAQALRADIGYPRSTTWMAPALCPSDAAYLIYTSGSTGEPKGVVSTHGGMRNLLNAQRSLLNPFEGQRFLQFASPSFDASVWEMLAVALGATLLSPHPDDTRPGPDLQRCLGTWRVNVATLPPTALSVMSEGSLTDLGVLFVAGEACPPSLAQRWAQGRRFVNAYGPTEASVCATLDEGGGDGHHLPIGRPIPNVDVHLLDAEGRLVPAGVSGQLYIGGEGLAHGYHRRPEMTDERFALHVVDGHQMRFYRTGDVGWRHEDGRIEFVGRADHQVKLRGFRIELGEIEAALARVEGVRHVAALVHADRLFAYVSVDDKGMDETGLRAHLQRTLPLHMVPARIVVQDIMPLTPSGKIDRKALPDPDAVLRDSKQAISPPSNPREQLLVKIWAEVLGLDGVGVDDAFFDVGGDSILAIQVVARANQAGLPITLNRLLTPGQQTVAALVASIADALPISTTAGSASDTADDAFPDDQSLQAGEVELPLTPIQRWFFDLDAPDAHHYNQAFLLEVAADFRVDLLTHAVEMVLQQHDALRLYFVKESTGWVQRLSPLSQAVVVEHELGPLGGTVAVQAVEQLAADFQASMTLSDGPRLRLALMRRGSLQSARLLVAVHHLAIDAVSWRVLLEDLFTAYQQAEKGQLIRPPARTSSFSRWARRLAAHAQGTDVQHGLPALMALLSPLPQLVRLPVKNPDAAKKSTVGKAVMLKRELTAEDTQSLLRSLPKRLGYSAQEALLAALCEATTDLMNGAGLLVDIEGHGRDVPLADIDLTRTVGWFTNIVTVLLKQTPANDAGTALSATRQSLTDLSLRGFNQSVLHHLLACDELLQHPRAEIAFNYLGQWDHAWPADGQVRPAPEFEGPGFAASTPRPYLLDVGAIVLGGQLRIDWTFDPAVLDTTLMGALADRHLLALERLLAAEPSVQLGDTASNGKPYTLAPQQAAMLAHAVAYPSSEAYVVQVAATLHHGLDVAAFQASWQRLLDRHVTLRAYFGVVAGQSVQYFADKAEPAWQVLDWRSLDTDAARAQAVDFMVRDRHAGLRTDAAPLMRFSLIRMADAWRFIWTHQHLLMDGWSMPILFEEVLSGIGSTLPSAPTAPDFRHYLEWLQLQDTAAAKAFWAVELAGLAQPTTAQTWPLTVSAGRLRFGETSISAASGLGQRIAAYAKRCRLTVSAVIMGCWGLLLAHRSGRDDVVFGVTSALRPPSVPGIESMLGPLINTLPLRVSTPKPGQSLQDWFVAIQRRRASQLDSAHIPLSSVAEAAGFPVDQAIFSTVLRIQNYPTGKGVSGEDAAALRFDDVTMVDFWHYPFNLEVIPGEGMKLIATFDLDAFDEQQAKDVLEVFCTLLSDVADGRETPLISKNHSSH